jgi:hypothetical protein
MIYDTKLMAVCVAMQEADLEEEVNRLRVVEALCDQLKADKEDTETKKDAMNVQLLQMRSQVGRRPKGVGR